MKSSYLLLFSLCLLSGVSQSQNETVSEVQVDLQQEQAPENSGHQETHLDEEHELKSSTMNSDQDCCGQLYDIGQNVGVLTETLRNTINKLEETTRRLEASEAKLAELNKTLSTALNKEKIQVAFSASFPVDGHITAGNSNRPIVYKHVETNLGNAYSPVTGFFTAPVHGVYAFSFTSYYWGRSESGGTLYRNGARVVSWFINNANHGTSGSNSAVLKLRAGDKVNVCLWSGRIIADNANKYSTFSGFLLYT